jgi:hypothetical protein
MSTAAIPIIAGNPFPQAPQAGEVEFNSSQASSDPLPLVSSDASAAISQESNMPFPLQSPAGSVAWHGSRTTRAAALLRTLQQGLETLQV